jgi:hypothetical protein
MRAKVTKAFDGVENGALYPRTYPVGEVVTGRLAEVALREKWAEEEKLDARPSGPVEIPEGWQELKAAELVKLARALGASADVNTRAEASAVIQAELERRATPPA